MFRPEGYHRSILYSEYSVPLDQLSLHDQCVLGVGVRTDSTELSTQLDLIKQVSGGMPIDDEVALFYLTQTDIVISEDRILTPMSREAGGEILTNFDLTQFHYKGIPKLGTLLSIIYGIRALRMASEQVLGIHSASIYDHEINAAHLVVGPSHLGKSSIGGLFENGDRFEMIADDWNEIDFNNGTVTPISPIFSGDYDSEHYEWVFQSFRKNYYMKRNSCGLAEKNLGTIFFLTRSREESPDSIDYFSNVESHIPLVTESIGSRNHEVAQLSCEQLRAQDFQQMMCSRSQELLNLYRRIFKSERIGKFTVVNDRTRDLQAIVSDMYKSI